MKATGNIQIKERVFENPTLDVQGIFEAFKEDESHDFYYLEVYLQENGEGTVHSRYWVVDTQDVATEFANIEELQAFS